jgi:DNA-binding winged helix-turn-helix (wHTH) protein
MSIRFDDFEIDPAAREVRRQGTSIGMEPKVFDLLVYLIENAARVVSRDDVITAVWDGRIVSDATVSSCIKAVRSVLGDDGKAQRYIKTIHGRGFRFVGSFQTAAILGAPAPAEGPSLAILPMQVDETDPQMKSISDNLADDMLTMLGRVPLLSLASRRTSQAIERDGLSPTDIHQQLNISYLLEGRLQRVTNGYRAHVQLVRAASGYHSWAQQFEIGETATLAEGLLTAILPRLESALVETMVADFKDREGTESTSAQLIHAMGLLSLKGWNRATFTEAQTILRALLERDPDQPIARAYLALIMGLGSRIGIFEASPDVINSAVAEAERALTLAGNDSTVLGLAGCALADVGQPDRAIPLLKKALELNPNNAQAWVALGAALFLVFDFESAREALLTGIRISAMDAQIAIWWSFLAVASLQLARLDDALDQARAG